MIDILVNLVKSVGMVSLAGMLVCCPVHEDRVHIQNKEDIQVQVDHVKKDISKEEKIEERKLQER